MAKALRERVGKQYTGTQRTRKAVHGECTVELAKRTFPIISLCREPYEAKVSRTGLTADHYPQLPRTAGAAHRAGGPGHHLAQSYGVPRATRVRADWVRKLRPRCAAP